MKAAEDTVFYGLCALAAFFGTTRCYSSVVSGYQVTGAAVGWALLASVGWLGLAIGLGAALEHARERRDS